MSDVLENSGLTLPELSGRAAAFVAALPRNAVPEIGLAAIYDAPLFAVASGGDPEFGVLKRPEAVAPAHLSPEEWLPGARSVISYFLPFSAAVRKSNYGAGLPSTEWVYARIEGEDVNNALRQFLEGELRSAGAQALIPVADPRFKVEQNRANWSERHVAYIAGLGTFGLSKSLITRLGTAGRFGSIITTLPLPATPREYRGLYDYCSRCGACIPRCPGSAITPDGKDHILCEKFHKEEVVPRFQPRYGCGKCQTAVPCEARAPGRKSDGQPEATVLR